MNRYVRLFSWSVWAGFFLTVLVALPGIFRPAAVADFLGVKPPTEPIWLAFAFLLLFITSWFHVAAALDPLDRLLTAAAVIFGHFMVALFFTWTYPKYIPGSLSWLGPVEFIIAAIQLVLFIGTVEDSTRLET